VEAIYAGQPFRTVSRDLGLTPNQVWGLTKTDQKWSENLEAALTLPGERTSSTARTRRTWRAVCAESAGSISGSRWAGTASNLAASSFTGPISEKRCHLAAPSKMAES
jgi:hypothetical protein